MSGKSTVFGVGFQQSFYIDCLVYQFCEFLDGGANKSLKIVYEPKITCDIIIGNIFYEVKSSDFFKSSITNMDFRKTCLNFLKSYSDKFEYIIITNVPYKEVDVKMNLDLLKNKVDKIAAKDKSSMIDEQYLKIDEDLHNFEKLLNKLTIMEMRQKDNDYYNEGKTRICSHMQRRGVINTETIFELFRSVLANHCANRITSSKFDLTLSMKTVSEVFNQTILDSQIDFEYVEIDVADIKQKIEEGNCTIYEFIRNQFTLNNIDYENITSFFRYYVISSSPKYYYRNIRSKKERMSVISIHNSKIPTQCNGKEFYTDIVSSINRMVITYTGARDYPTGYYYYKIGESKKGWDINTRGELKNDY